MSGHVDSAVLERMAKIMSYMRVSGGKPSKKPKKKDKLAALHGMAGAPGANFPIVHGSQHIMPKPAGVLPCCAMMLCHASRLFGLVCCSVLSEQFVVWNSPQICVQTPFCCVLQGCNKLCRSQSTDSTIFKATFSAFRPAMAYIPVRHSAGCCCSCLNTIIWPCGIGITKRCFVCLYSKWQRHASASSSGQS